MQKNKKQAWFKSGVNITLATSRKTELEKMSWMSKSWDSKLFCDVNIFCGLDRKVVKTSRLFLSGLSPILRNVFLEHNSSNNEDVALLLPDVDSETLSNFLKNVCSGQKSLAKIDKSLNFLDFGNIPDSDTTPKSGPDQTATETDDEAENSSSGNDASADSYSDVSVIMESSTMMSDEPSFDAEELPRDDTGKRALDTDEAFEVRKKFRKRASLAWKFFQQLNGQLSECLLCKDLVGSSGGTTTGMLKHLKRVHNKGKKTKTEPMEENASYEEQLSNFADLENGSDVEPAAPTSDHLKELLAEASMEPKDEDCQAAVRHANIRDESNFSKDDDDDNVTEITFEGRRESESDDDGGRQRVGEEQQFQEVEKPKSNRKRISLAWRFFKRLNVDKSVCILCRAAVATVGGTTSGMLKHLKKYHRDVFSGDQTPVGLKNMPKQKKKPSGQKLSNSESIRMRPEVFSSSPVWMIFKPSEDNPADSKCSLCNVAVDTSEGSTHPLIHHLRDNHALTFNKIQSQLENPDVPETFDAANPLWLFFAIADEKSVECINCLNVFVAEESGTGILTDHLSSEHQELYADYLHQCNQWQLQRREEFLTYKSSLSNKHD